MELYMELGYGQPRQGKPYECHPRICTQIEWWDYSKPGHGYIGDHISL